MRRNPSPLLKRCRVCADQASGFNFAGLTCESCKAFFRRNALQTEFKCKRLASAGEGKCSINLLNRSQCRRCRLDRCREIGMNPDLIQYTTSKSPTVVSPERPLAGTYEILRFNELSTASSVFLDETSLAIVDTLQSESAILNLSGMYLLRAVRFCKRLPGFACLPPADQLALLKGFFPQMTSIRISFQYRTDLEGWTGLESETTTQSVVLVKLETLHTWKRHRESVTVFEAFIRALNREMKGDTVLRNLLLAVLLFKNAAGDLKESEAIRQQHAVYTYLLRRHLEGACPSRGDAEKRLRSLAKILAKLDYVVRLLRQMYFDMKDCQLGEGLVEIYNL